MKRQETMAEFKHRIALLMRNREGGKVYSIIRSSPTSSLRNQAKKSH
jgi:hypothetical protein